VNQAAKILRGGSAEAGKALAWLHSRGLKDETIRKARLGWIPKDWWHRREEWGLPRELRPNGRPKGLWVSRGLCIPVMEDDQVLRVKIRRGAPDLKYYAPPGAPAVPMVLRGAGNAWVVVESELDGILLCQEAGELVSVIALGSATIRPRGELLELLEGAPQILVALDSDQAGAKEAHGWWLKTFPRAKRWPCPRGKDPSDAWKSGLDLKLWIDVGLRKAVGLGAIARRDPEEPKQTSQPHHTEHPRAGGGDTVAPVPPPDRDFILEREAEGAGAEGGGSPSSPAPQGPPASHEALLQEVAAWPEGLREEWEERSAIIEFDGLLPREEAEKRAHHLLSHRLGAYQDQGQEQDQDQGHPQGQGQEQGGHDHPQGQEEEQGGQDQGGHPQEEIHIFCTEDGYTECRI